MSPFRVFVALAVVAIVSLVVVAVLHLMLLGSIR